MSLHSYQQDLPQTAANHVPLSPLSYIERAAAVYPHRTAIVHGSQRFSWQQAYERSRRLASALACHGISKGDTVAVMLPNIPAMLDCHFGVPMCGAVLNTLNTRLDPEAIAFMLQHGEARVLITDREFSFTIAPALALLDKPILVIDVDDPEYSGPGKRLGSIEYEAFIAGGDPDYAWQLPDNEWDAISLNYTSGTTGNPKGVVYHHRGAYLNASCNILDWGMPRHATYLWTLPMFHCNGWCFPWTMAANVGTNVCLRRVDPRLIFELIKTHRVSHYCGAPIVHNMLINAPDDCKQGIAHQVNCLVAGAAPPSAVIEGMETLGFNITHVYGLTETYGPASVCAKQDEWADMDIGGRTERNGRQGVRYTMQQGMTVMDPATMTEVPHDGETMGEIMFRGNLVMKGYLKNARATEESLAGGWFHTGDLAVIQPDGYVKIKDRSKDIIISGGENISSIEVEDVLCRFPGVISAAVVALPDPKWGEVPCAFLEMREGVEGDEAAVIEHCRAHLARFKVPKRIIFGPIPKTSTGKIQKFLLRQQTNAAAAIQ
ncbi:acyl-CoA synthetase [Vogesella sp. XCS3]|uniref:acyl-CoA synthetase n=1 Tax=Vogesella sp. XCS3 TaxID=2877939 RepID=UPI001D0A0DA0|nr:acyl-CoA synthetase [Vogesella sp. XCS3]UDM17338.1 acyl-CoA synthetase [Vogesella sp. XCS3]